MAEQLAAPSTFRIVARRSTETRDIPDRKELHLGDQEREDLSEVATVATLEITPAQATDGWRLTVTVEDEIGPRALEGDLVSEQQIDLGTFYSQFIRPGRGTGSVMAEVQDPAAEARITGLLDAIERDLHGPTGADSSSARRRAP
jgi:hypothetical protein